MNKILAAAALIIVSPASVSAAQELFAKGDLVASYRTTEAGETYELQWAHTASSWNQHEIFITQHKGVTAFFPDHIVKIYARDGDEYRLLKTLSTGGNGYFREPKLFWYDAHLANGRTEHLHLLQVTQKIYGTGSFTEESIYEVKHDGSGVELVPVKYIPAPHSFQVHLAEGEAVWKGENNSLSETGLNFEFYIWREDFDGNCCPSGGRVTGQYKIVRNTEPGLPEYRMEMDSYERVTYDHLNP